MRDRGPILGEHESKDGSGFCALRIHNSVWTDPKSTGLRDERTEKFSAQFDMYRTVCCILRRLDCGIVRETEGQDRRDRLGLEREAKLLLGHEAKRTEKVSEADIGASRLCDFIAAIGSVRWELLLI